MSLPRFASYFRLIARAEWWLRSAFLKMQLEKEREEAGALAALNPELAAGFAERERKSKIELLRGILQKVPFWLPGHLQLAELSLLQRDIATAYASSQAVLVLQPKDLERDWAHLHLGRCYLQRGQLEAALEQFCAISPSGEVGIVACEERAAALLALGRTKDAADCLEAIPLGQRSHSAEAALQYARKHTSS